MKSFLKAGAMAVAVSGFLATQALAAQYDVNFNSGSVVLGTPIVADDLVTFAHNVPSPGAIDSIQFTVAANQVLNLSANATASNSSGSLNPFALEIDEFGSAIASVSGSTLIGLTNVFLFAGHTYTLIVTSGGAGFYNGNVTFAAAPLPATLPFLATGLAGLWAWRRRKNEA